MSSKQCSFLLLICSVPQIKPEIATPKNTVCFWELQPSNNGTITTTLSLTLDDNEQIELQIKDGTTAGNQYLSNKVRNLCKWALAGFQLDIS